MIDQKELDKVVSSLERLRKRLTDMIEGDPNVDVGALLFMFEHGHYCFGRNGKDSSLPRSILCSART